MAVPLPVFLFPVAAIPPLAGFFGKLYVFLAAIEAELYALAVIGVVASVLGAFYYLRIVKLMYFDEPIEDFARPLGWEMTGVLAASSVVIVLFFAVPGLIVEGAAARAAR